MPDRRTLPGTLHEATHRVPGIPVHRERATGHHGATRHSATRPSAARHSASRHGRGRSTTTARRSAGRAGNHSPARPPRVLVAWQRRIAALFGQEL
jgi:hypothetical protein